MTHAADDRPPDREDLNAPDIDEVEAGDIDDVEAAGIDEVEAGGIDDVEAPDVEDVEAGDVEDVEAGDVEDVEAGDVEDVEAGDVEDVEAGDVEDVEAGDVEDVEAGDVEDVEAGDVEDVEAGDVEDVDAANSKHRYERNGDATGALADAELVAIAQGALGADGEIHVAANPDGAVRAEPAQTVEALLFLAPDPLSVAELAEAARLSELEVDAALAIVAERYAKGERGVVLRQLGGGFTFASHPACEDAARRLFSRPRVATLSPAQAETLAIVAYLQPVSRPEITRIRGVSADSATNTLLERGLIEQHGRSQYGAVTYRTTMLFMKLFGLRSLDELPDIARWDPGPAEQAQLYERLMRAGDARAGDGPAPE